MPRLLVIPVASFLLAALCLVLPAQPVHGAVPPSRDVADAAEAHGLRCDPVEDLGDGASHLTCVREPADQTETNIDLSVTYNLVSEDDGFAFATVAAYTTPLPSDWLDVATSVALLFCEEPSDAVRQAVASSAPVSELNGCALRASDDEFARSLDISPMPPTDEPQAADDLAGYLDAYGLSCADESAATTSCTLDVDDEDGLDAAYEVVTRMDAAGDVIGVAAVVSSLDESMPSDAVGFLRGVAERLPVEDPDGLLAWFDAALSGSAAPYEAGEWSVTWADAAAGSGRTLTLAAARVGETPSALPSAAQAPAASVVPSAAPGAPGAPAAPAADAARPFAASVPEPAQVSADPTILLQSGLLAALLVFLMPFPSQLFNSTLETHEDEVRRWFRLDRVGGMAAGMGAFWTSWPGIIVFTLLAALLYGFLDPGFGFGLGSLATVLGMLIGIVLVTAAFATPALMAHRRDGARPSVKVVPLSLMVGIACVLLSRVTGFQPGYLYGLLIGLVFARELSAAEEGRTTAIGAVLMIAVSLSAWLGLGVLPDGDGFGLVVLRTALAALMVAGLEGVVFGLLPMRFLPGEPLYAWNRIIWGTLLGIGAFAFFHILINPASGYLSDTSRTPLLTVLGLLIGFSAVSVAFWGWFRFRASAPASPEAGGSG